jgi:uncharacterized protein
VRIARRAVLSLLWTYKRLVSPWLPPSCRYVPTCSEYAMEAVERYGALRGSWMTMTRLLRCHPFAKGGYDPVQPAERPHRRCEAGWNFDADWMPQDCRRDAGAMKDRR